MSATSPNHINAMDMEQGYGDGENPVVLKSEFLLSLCEQLMGSGKLSAKEKSIIDRCAAQCYREYIRRGYTGAVPTLQDFHAELLRQPEPEARDVALALSCSPRAASTPSPSPPMWTPIPASSAMTSGTWAVSFCPWACWVVAGQHLQPYHPQPAQQGRNTWIYIDEIYPAVPA